MLKRRKPVTMLMTIVLVIALLASCSGNGSGTIADKTEAPTNKPTGQAPSNDEWTYQMGGPVAEENINISILTHSGHGSTLAIPSKDLPVYQKLDERLEVTIDWQIIENAEYSSLVNVRLMSSDLPDMVVMLNRTDADKLIEDEFFWAYDDLDYEQNTPYAQMLFEDPDYSYLPTTYRSIYDDGKIYAFGNTIIPRMLFINFQFNHPWLNKLGLEEPSTHDEVLDILRAFRDNDMNENGQNDEVPLALNGELRYALGHGFSLDLNNNWSVNENGELIFEYVRDEYLDYLKFRKTLYDENLVDKENRGMTEYYELIGSDRLGCLAYYATFQNTISGYHPEYVEGDYIFREILPLKNKYTGERMMYSRLGTGMGEGMYILKESENPEVCLRISDFLWASEEWEMLRHFGVEGLSYEYDNDGNIVRIEPDDYDGGGVSYLTSIGGGQPPFTNRQSIKAWEVNYSQYPWMLERAEELQPYYIDGLAPLVFNATDTVELAKYSTDVNTYKDEMTASFIEGRASLDDFDDYVDQLYKLGLTQMTEIYQRKYDSMNN